MIVSDHAEQSRRIGTSGDGCHVDDQAAMTWEADGPIEPSVLAIISSYIKKHLFPLEYGYMEIWG